MNTIREEIDFPEALWAEVQHMIDVGYYSDVESLVLSAVGQLAEHILSTRESADKQWVSLSEPVSATALQMALSQAADALMRMHEELNPFSTVPLTYHLAEFKGIVGHLRHIRYVGSRNPEFELALRPVNQLLLIDGIREGVTLDDIATVLDAIARYHRANKDCWPAGQLEEMREAAQIARWMQTASTKICIVVDVINDVVDLLREKATSPSQGELCQQKH